MSGKGFRKSVTFTYLVKLYDGLTFLNDYVGLLVHELRYCPTVIFSTVEKRKNQRGPNALYRQPCLAKLVSH